ncbi:MAG: hypothetical protein ACFC03_02325 [Candidatus Malihini olakiniferum]
MTIRDINNWRVKETDCLKESRKTGATMEEDNDYIRITPTP